MDTKLRVTLEIVGEHGYKCSIHKSIDIEDFLDRPEKLREVVKQCESELRSYEALQRAKMWEQPQVWDFTSPI